MDNRQARRSNKERFFFIGEVKFGESRTLVVSILGARLVLGQRFAFKNDDGSMGKVYGANAPNLDIASAEALIAALTKGIAELKRRVAPTTTTGRE